MPYLLVFLAAIVAYDYFINYMLEDYFNNMVTNGMDVNSAFGFLLFILLFFFASITYTVMIQSSAIFYIKSYIQNKGLTRFEDVKKWTYSNFWKYFGLVFGMMLMLILGIGLFILPGLYLMVPLYLVLSISGFENKGFSDSISYSFVLIKNNWWMTFLTILVILVVVCLMSLIFSLPAIVYKWVSIFISASEQNYEYRKYGFPPITIVLSVFSNFFQLLIGTLYIISAAFIYFSLSEKKNLTGAMETIGSIGQKPPDNS